MDFNTRHASLHVSSRLRNRAEALIQQHTILVDDPALILSVNEAGRLLGLRSLVQR